MSFSQFNARGARPLGGCLAACSCTSAPCMGAEKLNDSPPRCGTAVGMLDLVRDAFARPTNNFPQRAHVGPFFCPVLCSEGPSMAVSCSAHAVTHVKVHHGPPPGHWNGRWRRGTTLKNWHPAKMTSRGCGLCEHFFFVRFDQFGAGSPVPKNST